MQTIDMMSALVIGGAGAFVGAGMMRLAMQTERSLRLPLRWCLWGFLVLGFGLSQNAFTSLAWRTPILVGAIATLVATALISRGLVAMATGRAIRHPALLDVLVLPTVLGLAWPQGHYIFGVVFHAMCLLVSGSAALALRPTLRAPRRAAEVTVAAALALYAATWAYGLVSAAAYSGPERRHLMYLPEPALSLYAATYALLPLVIGALVLNLANARLGQRLRVQAGTDELTGLLSRRALHEGVDAWHAEVLAQGRLAALLLIDVDHFKRINDTHGHERGDDVLRALARLMPRQLRAGTRLARYGGEEFLALLDAASLDEAVQAAERLRASIAAAPLGEVPVTISIGVAAWPTDVAFARALARADVALYEAKRAGRDRVVLDVEPAGGRRAGETAG